MNGPGSESPAPGHTVMARVLKTCGAEKRGERVWKAAWRRGWGQVARAGEDHRDGLPWVGTG